jgi:hypothetical protein
MPSPKNNSPHRPAHLTFNVLNRLSGQNLARLSTMNRLARAIIKADPRLSNKIVRAKMARVHANLAARRTAYFRGPCRTCGEHLYPNTARASSIHRLRRSGRAITPERRHPRRNLNNHFLY